MSSIPKDFTWDELVAAREGLGFGDISDNGGACRTFATTSGLKIFFSKAASNQCREDICLAAGTQHSQREWITEMSDQTLSYNGYRGSIEVSAEDGCLHGKLLAINDLVTYEADSPAALDKAFREAVDFYIEKCAREGLEAEKSESVSPESERSQSPGALH